MIMNAAYKVLTAHAFSGRVKVIAAIAAAAKGHGNVSADCWMKTLGPIPMLVFIH